MTEQATIIIQTGNSYCNVYYMPYPMRPRQHPMDLEWKYQKEWKLIGRLDHHLTLVYLDARFAHLKKDIEFQMGGTFLTVNKVDLDA